MNRNMEKKLPGPNSNFQFTMEHCTNAFISGIPENETHADIVFEFGQGVFI